MSGITFKIIHILFRAGLPKKGGQAGLNCSVFKAIFAKAEPAKSWTLRLAESS